MGRGSIGVWGVFFLLLAACGRAPTPEEKIEFEPYLRRFNAFSRQQGRSVFADISITYGNLKGRHLGMCDEGWLRASRVEINRGAWKTSDDATREVMIFHELGHCVLGRPHIDTSISLESLNAPKSIMATHGVPGQIYSKYQSYYVQELFSTVE